MGFYRACGVAEARQLLAADWDRCIDIAEWCGGTLTGYDDYASFSDAALMFLPTPEPTGTYADDTDWIVDHGPGGFRVLPNEIFIQMYEAYR